MNYRDWRIEILKSMLSDGLNATKRRAAINTHSNPKEAFKNGVTAEVYATTCIANFHNWYD